MLQIDESMKFKRFHRTCTYTFQRLTCVNVTLRMLMSRDICHVTADVSLTRIQNLDKYLKVLCSSLMFYNSMTWDAHIFILK